VRRRPALSAMVFLAGLLAATFAALSVLHIYWSMGGRWGHAAALPERSGRPAFEPGMLGTFVVAGLLAAASLVVLGRVGVGPAAGLRRLTHLGAWTIAAVLLLRGIGDFRLVGLFRSVGDTRFAWWDRRVYTPLALALALGVGIVAASAAW
jgi:Protein of unknown function (DUF3995)